MEAEKKKIIQRLKRIEGQIRGVQRLIENGASCTDVLTQVSAVTSAMKKTGGAIIAAHMNTCLEESSADQGSTRDDFRKALSRYIDLS